LFPSNYSHFYLLKPGLKNKNKNKIKKGISLHFFLTQTLQFCHLNHRFVLFLQTPTTFSYFSFPKFFNFICYFLSFSHTPLYCLSPHFCLDFCKYLFSIFSPFFSSTQFYVNPYFIFYFSFFLFSPPPIFYSFDFNFSLLFFFPSSFSSTRSPLSFFFFFFFLSSSASLSQVSTSSSFPPHLFFIQSSSFSIYFSSNLTDLPHLSLSIFHEHHPNSISGGFSLIFNGYCSKSDKSVFPVMCLLPFVLG
jgi:hypothetical protein